MSRRVLFLVPVLGLLGGLVTTASAASGNLPGGTAISVAIAAPTNGAPVVAGTTVTVTGTASVAEAAAVKDTDLVFVLDVSGSTGGLSGVPGCTTILDCEKQAVRNLVADAQAPRSPIAAIGGVTFPNSATLPLAAPNTAATDTFLNSLTPSSGTDFSAGITAARAVLANSTAEQRLIVLLTDGDGTSNPNEGAITAVVLAFTIAGTGCTDVDLDRIVDLGLPGSDCEVVTDLGDLSGVISDSIGSSLTGVGVAVDNGPTITATTTPGLPLTGPASVTFSASVSTTGLTAGPHSICATASGADAGGTGVVSDCVTIDVLATGSSVVDCAGTSTCSATATDPGRSTLAFSAPAAFDEQVVIEPSVGPAGACGGQNCRTGYEVGFPTNNPNGPIASVTVVTANAVSLADRLRAAVFIDGTRITAQCNNRLLIRGIRNLLGIPEPIPCITIRYVSGGKLEYFVKFNADPTFRFR